MDLGRTLLVLGEVRAGPPPVWIRMISNMGFFFRVFRAESR